MLIAIDESQIIENLTYKEALKLKRACDTLIRDMEAAGKDYPVEENESLTTYVQRVQRLENGLTLKFVLGVYELLEASNPRNF